jgi:hypothetical protein
VRREADFAVPFERGAVAGRRVELHAEREREHVAILADQAHVGPDPQIAHGGTLSRAEGHAVDVGLLGALRQEHR